ncbi:MAG TPA: YkgJ family cysteine cluster protein [Kofleriaceae bacterium]
MQCDAGCSDCCHVRLTITAVEAAAIRAHVTTWTNEQRRNLADTGPIDRRSRAPGDGDPDGIAGGAGVLPRGIDRCAALDPAGRCKIYLARPLVCRSHGVPIRMRRGALPVVESCHRNFTRTTPDPDCVLDQETLSATLLAVDVAEAQGTGTAGASSPPARVDLAALLADLAVL